MLVLHCIFINIILQVLNKRFGSIKGAVSDLHRDVTTRRCLTSYDRVEDIVRECVTIKTDLDKADDMMDDHKMEFEKRWQQEQLRIKTEQAMFNEQVCVLSIVLIFGQCIDECCSLIKLFSDNGVSRSEE